MFGQTIEYTEWQLKTETHELIGADTHIVFLESGEEVFLKDLRVGDKIITDSGVERVISIECTNKQSNMYDVGVDSENHRFYTNGILSHNSTAYSVYVLWYVLMNENKSVLICANKFKTAKDILSRVKMAYEMLPNWLKPGIITWNAASIEFSNGCKVTAEATSESSGRGGSINCLICDEFAFLQPNLEEAFMNSVFPVVSSSKTSQIIIVSTPNGSGNEFYRIWNKALLNKNKTITDDSAKWTPVKIDWWEVPGRDEKWKKEQMETFNGSEERFNQEYGNCVGGNSMISVYDIEKNEYKEITIKELYEYLNKMNNIIESEETDGKQS